MITAYQFIKFKESDFDAFYSSLFKKEIFICFDLEDNIVDFKLANTNKYKEIYRKKIIDLITKHKGQIKAGSICFNINEIGSYRYFEDLDALHKILDHKISTIFIPKINNINCLERFISDTSSLIFEEFVPVIETNDAFQNIEDILSFKNAKFKRFAFGHSDYNLNCNIFPFIHHNNPKYWEWIERFAEVANKFDKIFINSPFMFLDDADAFCSMLIKMKQYFKTWGQVCFSTSQSYMCVELPALLKYDELYEDNFRHINSKSKYARFIVDSFEKYNKEGSGFAICPDGNYFISPQEYVASKRFLYEPL